MRFRWLPFAAAAVVLLLLVSIAPAIAYDEDDEDEDEYEVDSDGEFSLNIGVFSPRADSERWDENQRLLTQDSDDFTGLTRGISFASYINPNFDFVVSVDYYNEKDDTRYRDFVFVNGDPIRQRQRLRLVPVDFSFRWLPVPRSEIHTRRVHRGRRGQRERREVEVFRPVVPYVGGGVGVLLWEYHENGDFVDDSGIAPVVFSEHRRSRDATVAFNALAGVEFQFSRKMAIHLEGKYRWAEDELESDFPEDEDEDKLDLSGGSLSAGLAFRW